ncbi:MAG: PTS system glucitol/sorbitol-specific EIIB component [Paracidovorax wautersii]|uniref:PTS system glucitol/sorbitol-specific EIIB component n=1 Tax=Paracidovorax wautersii TaxID=1177982 RepID=A0A7V8FRS1_9BURK|nr:MAG: PTS system glucitol/sorbitol-specific EIIB component [Paracidovorax wautersii]
MSETSRFRPVQVSSGPGGWGGPLVIQPTAERDKIMVVTGGSVPEVARRLAELTGAQLADGFHAPPPESEVAAVVIDCGGTARCGVYPRKRIPTINLTPVGKSGPLADYISEDIYVSGVTVQSLALAGQGAAATAPATASAFAAAAPATVLAGAGAGGASLPLDDGANSRGLVGFITGIGRAMGGVVNVLFASGRKSIDQVLRNILPFMAFVTMLIGLINSTGIGTLLAHLLEPLAGNVFGLLVLSAICGLPFLSPILGPGAVIGQVIGAAIIGPAIARGVIPPAMALPALFAYNTQVGCDFVPVGLALGEAKPDTIRVSVPAVLISRQIMGPVSVVIAWAASFLL